MAPPHLHTQAPADLDIPVLKDRLPAPSGDRLPPLATDHAPVSAPVSAPIRVQRLGAAGAAGSSGAVRIVRGGGMQIAVRAADHAMATALVSAALRMDRFWGLVSVRAVIERAQAQSQAQRQAQLQEQPHAPIQTATEEKARQILGALPRARWLDDHRQWFSFGDPNGGLETALDKVFAIAGRVRLDELRAALAKTLPGVRAAPPDAMRRYLVGVGRCVIDGPAAEDVVDPLAASFVDGFVDGFVDQLADRFADSFVHRAPLAGAHRPTRQEAAIVRLIQGAGGELPLEALRRRARTAALPRTTLNQLVTLSPLLVVTPHQRVRLIGDRHLALYA